jgi:hypothetical protein
MNTSETLIVTKHREMHTHLGCKVEVETVFDSRTRLTSQNIVLSTSAEHQAEDASQAGSDIFEHHSRASRRRK